MSLLTKDMEITEGGEGGARQASLPPAQLPSKRDNTPSAALERLKMGIMEAEKDSTNDSHNNHKHYHQHPHNNPHRQPFFPTNPNSTRSTNHEHQNTSHKQHNNENSSPHSSRHSIHSSRHSCASETGVRWVLTLGHLWLCCVWVLLATPVNTCADSNGCDFYGSGLEQDGRGVQPVYLNCASGRVEWQYPRAGLRVILKSPHKDRDFHACIKGHQGFRGARIYLEGHRSLLPIFSLDDGRPRELIRCFTSYKGQAALYVEAEPGNDDLKKQVATFEYDLQTLPKGATYDPQEECRPCTEEELLHYYCSGDFVARGTILGVRDYSKLSHTTITIGASKIIQQTSPVFRHGHAPKTPEGTTTGKVGNNEELLEENGDPFDEEGELWRSNLIGDGFVGRVEMPIHCGAKAGPGEFLVMGVMRLGHAVLRCAPKHEEWKALALKSQNRAQCVLET